MGRKKRDPYVDYFFKVYNSNPPRKPRQSSGDGRANHNGGYGDPVHGFLDGLPVTAAFGWGTKEGHTLLADGHVDLGTFKRSENHNHYGPGQGRNYNVYDRFKYTGPGH